MDSQSAPATAIPAAQLESTAPPSDTPAPPSKPIHSLILDTGPLIKNDPPLSTLLATAQELYTLPSVITEVRDAVTRARVETQLLPFVKLRSPKPESIQHITTFARKTGDLEVLSRPDLHLIALAYEIECERNGGDWRLRKEPGQKGLNSKAPEQKDANEGSDDKVDPDNSEIKEGEIKKDAIKEDEEIPQASVPEDLSANQAEVVKQTDTVPSVENGEAANEQKQDKEPVVEQEAVFHQLESLQLEPTEATHTSPKPPTKDTAPDAESPVAENEEDDDDDGWITPSNLKKHQAKDKNSLPEEPIQKLLQVALLTSDYAMQNVLLRMNLNLVSPTLARITRVKTWVLRCHGCFQITRAMDKQFCPRCGQPTLTRVSCSTDQNGNFSVHLKKNFQWNKRGNVYSVPKPTHGTANGKYRGHGGGKNGWGNELILAEDQKEYVKHVEQEKKIRQRDLMDEDYLPSILTGNRQGSGGRMRVGAGRNVNSKKR